MIPSMPLPPYVTLDMAGSGLWHHLPIHRPRWGPLRGVIPALYHWAKMRPDVASATLLREGGITEVAAPNTIERPPEAFFEAITTQGGTGMWDAQRACFQVGHPPWFTAHIQNAYVEGDKGWIVTQDRYLVLDSLAHDSFLYKHRIEERVRWPSVRRITGRATVPYTHWSATNYFHWMIEALPRLYPLLTDSAYDDVQVVVPADPPDWMRQTLTRLGVAPERLVFAGDEQLQVDELIFVARTGKPCFVRDELVRWLAGQLGTQKGPDAAEEGSYVYVSRNRVPPRPFGRRALVNEDAVWPMLEARGFKQVFLEELTLTEQIQLFGSARLIVAPHGAGLTNLLFASQAAVIELFEPSYVIPLYYVLARQLGHTYWYLLNESAPGGDMVVDVAALERVVAQAQAEVVHED